MFATIRLAQRQALDAAVRAPDVGDYWGHRGSGDLRASFVVAAYYSQNSAARFVLPPSVMRRDFLEIRAAN